MNNWPRKGAHLRLESSGRVLDALPRNLGVYSRAPRSIVLTEQRSTFCELFLLQLSGGDNGERWQHDRLLLAR